MLEKKLKELDEKYLKEGASKIDDGDVKIAAENQEQISDKILNSSMLKKYTEIGKLMFGMLQDYRSGTYRNIPWFSIAAITFAFLYILNPFDIVPDFIPGLGYIDDFAIMTITLRFLETDLHSYLDWKLAEGDSEEEEEPEFA
ncbi:YkvA family protein [Salegentibacter sp. F188]|uniref:YkvA family protein n=1 Tax=Autumnicola patrickiae TaxID=3075591 RepID=A0ABU3E0H1_9FLAO|nr:YkvA family protein [Salegentibacter sp. F188]MDT0689498.1 YkvA family protein [Salegentibacter sp. F188]